MSQPHKLSDEMREDLYDVMIESRRWPNAKLIEAIMASPGISDDDLNAWPREDLVEEVIDLIEENYNGKALSVDAGGMFIVDMNTLQKERELMDVKMAQHEPVDLAALGCISCGFSVPETLQCLEAQVADNEYGTLPMPFETPGGSRISFSHDGKMSVLVQGVESRELLEDGFKDLSSISSSRERAIKLVSEMGMAKDQKVESESSLSM